MEEHYKNLKGYMAIHILANKLCHRMSYAQFNIITIEEKANCSFANPLN